MTPTVAVVTDSASSLPAELAERWHIRVIPLQIVVNGSSFAEGAEISPNEVLAHLVAGDPVSTSQPSPAQFEEAYRDAAAAGATAVVAVVLSGKLSGTVSAAETAAVSAAIPVTVVDSGTVGMAAGYAALAAAATAANGADADAVAAAARRVAQSSLCMFTVDSLEFLRRGGRISPATAAVGKVLGVRPLLEVRDGEVALFDRVRTTARARAALVECADEAIGEHVRPAVAVMALGEADYADDATRVLELAHPHLAMSLRTSVSAVLSAHAGPGALAVVVVDLPADVH
ncbi:DegV family protein [Demequina sp.]|uniref:DegV family protein n=1 Tax=Demequina sp. TaxID=2050685 RepID=UPI003D14112D